MKRLLLTVAVVACGSALTLAAAAAEKIPVFITSAQTAEGFTDPDRTRGDSVKDLANKIQGSKLLRLAETEADATIVLSVLSRETKRQWGHLLGPQNRSSLTVQLTAGAFTADLTGTGGASGVMSGYGKAAGEVVKQLEKWAKDNRERLVP